MGMRRIALAVTCCLAVFVSGSAAADQMDKRLDHLFATLQKTQNTAEARVTQDLIWSVWLHSDEAAVRGLMDDGVAAMGEGRLDAALGIFNEMVVLAPEFAEGWNKRATVQYLLGNFIKSIADVEETLALEPRHFGALSGLGQIYLLLGDEEGALSAFEQALAVHPHLSGARAAIDFLREKVRGRQL